MAFQHGAEWAQSTVLEQHLDVFWGSATSEVANGPGSFYLTFVVSAREHLNQRNEQVCLDHRFNLLDVSSQNVRQCPNDLEKDEI